MLKTIIIDSIIISGMIITSLYFQQYRWFVNFCMITIGILSIITYVQGLANETARGKLYKYYDEHNYRSIIWRSWDNLTDIVTVACLVYFNYRVAAVLISVGILFAYNFKKEFYNKTV